MLLTLSNSWSKFDEFYEVSFFARLFVVLEYRHKIYYFFPYSELSKDIPTPEVSSCWTRVLCLSEEKNPHCFPTVSARRNLHMHSLPSEVALCKCRWRLLPQFENWSCKSLKLQSARLRLETRIRSRRNRNLQRRGCFLAAKTRGTIKSIFCSNKTVFRFCSNNFNICSFKKADFGRFGIGHFCRCEFAPGFAAAIEIVAVRLFFRQTASH